MKISAKEVKSILIQSISQLCSVSWMFTEKPLKDFTRNRKLSFRDVIMSLIAMEGSSLTSELYRFFGCNVHTASSSAFVQRRAKISHSALSSLFDMFVNKSDQNLRYKGLRLFAVDGSDFRIASNPEDTDSFFPGTTAYSPYNMMHLDAMYDLLQKTYVDASAVGKRKANEMRALIQMVDRSCVSDALVIVDRGYERYNVMAHIQEKGWNFLIRLKDIHSKCGICSGLQLPQTDCFDIPVNLCLTTKHTNDIKELSKCNPHYRIISTSKRFDFLPTKNSKHQPATFYNLSFRLVRFELENGTYETIATNLDSERFPTSEIKRLYALRWGIETSFRELKYTVGLLNFHAKKVEYIYQEIFARLIMYNFSELITSSVIVRKVGNKHTYKANFSAAVHICRQFFLGNVSPPDVETLIRKHISPIRPGRKNARRMLPRKAVSFTYRVA